MACVDGSQCDVISLGWDCCASHGGRAQCPANKPVMCADLSCSNDHCCDFAGYYPCFYKGGPRQCGRLRLLFLFSICDNIFNLFLFIPFLLSPTVVVIACTKIGLVTELNTPPHTSI